MSSPGNWEIIVGEEDRLVARASACSGELEFAVLGAEHTPGDCRLKPAAAR